MRADRVLPTSNSTRASAAAVLVAAAISCPFAFATTAEPLPPYEEHLKRAERGEAESQNLLGVMHFLGDGAAQDAALARAWFQRAADRGHETARRNLAFLNSQVPAAKASAKAPRGEEPPAAHAGEEPYMTHCSMCHGTNGISVLPGAPMFALGERLDRGIPALLFTVMDGHMKGDQLLMPGFDSTLSLKQMTDLITYVRMLRKRYVEGVAAMRRTAEVPVAADASPDSRGASSPAEGTTRERRKN